MVQLGVLHPSGRYFGSPYTAALEEKTKYLIFASDAALSRFMVPVRLLMAYLPGSFIDSPAALCAAICMIESTPSRACLSCSGKSVSP